MQFEAIEDPLEKVEEFRAQAKSAKLALPEAMTLATVSPEGRPRARVVLLKGRSDRRLHFFTNYESGKARDLAANPFAEVCIHYPSLALQARVRGGVAKLSPAESEAYFATRPRESQIGAWASAQSRVLGTREELDARVQRYEAQFATAESVPCPPHWGGYALEAEEVELWVGQSGRLHDRAIYKYVAGAWRCERLFP